MSCFNDLIPFHRISPGWRGGCQGWTPLARGPFVEGEPRLQHPHTTLPDEYLSLSFHRLKVGVGDRGGRLNKDAQEVILQGYIQGSSINGCLKMAVGWWWWGSTRRGGWISGTRGGTHGGSGLQGEPAPLDSSVTRLSGP